jgi:hypothetical protein
LGLAEVIVRHCLEKTAEERFQSARDLAFALEISGQAACLPDAKGILIDRDSDLMRLDLASGAATPVVGVDARTLFIVDAAGKWLAYKTSECGTVGISAVPVAGGTPRLVVTARSCSIPEGGRRETSSSSGCGAFDNHIGASC